MDHLGSVNCRWYRLQTTCRLRDAYDPELWTEKCSNRPGVKVMIAIKTLKGDDLRASVMTYLGTHSSSCDTVGWECRAGRRNRRFQYQNDKIYFWGGSVERIVGVLEGAYGRSGNPASTRFASLANTWGSGDICVYTCWLCNVYAAFHHSLPVSAKGDMRAAWVHTDDGQVAYPKLKYRILIVARPSHCRTGLHVASRTKSYNCNVQS
jgi:hypothetical protein